ncbi:MAG TPA: tyrosine-type recombinase/integrase [Pseudolabrys sp.]|nr:tyrosine-type recombinase/integrase [Pseudolabrys sp.]
MSRTTQEANLQSPTARARLAVRVEPYYRSLQRGLALGYRRGKNGGSWLARTRDPVRDGYTETKIGPADDEGEQTVQGLSYDEATQRAREIFAQEEAKRTSGVQPGAKRKVVDDVLDLYVVGYTSGDARRDKKPGRDLKNLKSILTVHVRPALGKIRLDQLNADMLEKFKADLASAPKLSRNGKAAGLTASDPSEDKDPDNKPSNDPDDREQHEERMRKRRARTNRIITPLRAALNHAVTKRMIATDTAWRTALKPYPDVDGTTVRYLELHECKALQDHADDDFRPLVTGALFTGGRYGSLGQLKVKDIDFRSRTALFRVTKSGKKQSVKLTAPACKFLKMQIVGKSANDYVFVKASGERWKPSDQARRMEDACAGAKIEPAITFHELRDTFASHLVMAGVPILTVSKLLGHADVRVTERHYAHLAPGYLQKAVDKHLPDFSARARRRKASPSSKRPGSTTARKARARGLQGHTRRPKSHPDARFKA